MSKKQMVKNQLNHVPAQLAVDFTTVPHRRENNPVSEKHLNDNRYHFAGQCATVLTLLQKGLPLTGTLAKEQFFISDLQRRIGDLGDCKSLARANNYTGDMRLFVSEFGIDVDREWELKKTGKAGKEMMYFLPENRNLFIANGWIINRKRWWFSMKYTPPDIIEQIKTYLSWKEK